MATFFDNFNFEPADNKETTTSYTVPPGMYAIVTATLSVSMRAHVDTLLTGILITDTQNYELDSSCTSVSIELRLKAGEVLTKVLTTGSASSSTSVFEAGYVHVSGTAIAELLVNSTTVSKVFAPGSCAVNDVSGTQNDDVRANVTGLSEVNWHISEYNKQGN
jgi:hypothetical protein